jgi:serine/threonine-protein phosphatase 5
MGNKGAFIHFTKADGMKPVFHQFTAAPHTPVKPMQYASMLSQF